MTATPTAPPLTPFTAELEAGERVGLPAAAAGLPVPPGTPKVSPSTLARWHKHGLVAADGRRVFLECRRFSGRLFTTAGAIRRFDARGNQRP